MKYYDMATKDLDRHLKIGWQTIVVLGGSLTTLGLGFKGDLPIPLAVSINLLFLGWCAINVFNSNIWSLRAIAFLANVEAIYFRKDEKKYFNMYAGAHPPWHFIDTLGNLFRLIWILGIITLFCFVYVIIDPTFGDISKEQDVTIIRLPEASTTIGKVDNQAVEHEKNHLTKLDIVRYAQLVFWLAPFNIAAVIFWFSTKKYRKCQERYLDFMKQSPGPGMVIDRTIVRPVDLRKVFPETQVESGDKIQSWAILDLGKKMERSSKLYKRSKTLLAVTLVISILLLVFFQDIPKQWLLVST